MMSSDFYFRDKIPVAVLGATRELGQKLVRLLIHHPWFEIATLCDSNEWIGQPYFKAFSEHFAPLPESIGNMQIQPCEIPFSSSLLFSTLHPQEAIARETRFAAAGYYVVSCASYELNHIPLIVAEVNREQLALIQRQHGGKGGIVANPKRLVIGLTLALKPLMEKFELEAVQVAASPLFEEDEGILEKEKSQIELQTLSVLGQLQGSNIQKATFKMSVQEEAAKTISVSVKFKQKVKAEDIIQAWRQFGSEPHRLQLPTAPYRILNYKDQPAIPQPESLDKNMSIDLESLRPCSVFDYTFDLSFSRLMRGTLGSMLLNAELLVAQGKIYW